MPGAKQAGEDTSDELNIDDAVDSLVQDVFGSDDDPEGASDSLQGKKAAGGDDLDPENPDVEDETEEEAPDLDDEEDPSGSKGKAAAAADKGVAGAEGAQTPVEAPQSVPAELKEKWSSVPQEFRDWYAKREKDFLDGTQQYRQRAEYGQMMHDTISPYMPYIQTKTFADGRPLAPHDAIAFLLNAEYQLQTGTPMQKAAMFAKLAKDYSIDLSMLPEADAQIPPELAPVLQPLVNQVQQLSGTLGAFQQSQLAAARAKSSQEVEAFASDKENHPYFDEVADDIVKFINMGLPLSDAYDRAVWANPVTRAKEQARLDKVRTDKAAREAADLKAKRDRAKAPNIRSTPTNRRPTAKVGTMDDTLRDKLHEINNRT